MHVQDILGRGKRYNTFERGDRVDRWAHAPSGSTHAYWLVGTPLARATTSVASLFSLVSDSGDTGLAIYLLVRAASPVTSACAMMSYSLACGPEIKTSEIRAK